MKRGHSVRFCRVRNLYVPRGVLKWVPKNSKVLNDLVNVQGLKFKRGPNFTLLSCFLQVPLMENQHVVPGQGLF